MTSLLCAVTATDLISPAYRGEQMRLHADPRGYGQRGSKWSARVNEEIWLHDCQSVLDYGCGQGSLAYSLRMSSHCPVLAIHEYDPAIPGKDDLPLPADMVVSTDVLEHVEPDRIGTVLDHLTSLAQKVIFLVVSLVETSKTLSDGRQAHILLRPAEWWQEQLKQRGWVVVRELASKKPEKQWAVVLLRGSDRE